MQSTVQKKTRTTFTSEYILPPPPPGWLKEPLRKEISSEWPPGTLLGHVDDVKECSSEDGRLAGVSDLLTVGMDILTGSRQANDLEVVETGRRRRWSAAEKLRIVEERFWSPVKNADRPEK
ncbi:hypothetical protein [Bradyrhizobium cosmicum]|uniref:hypothetical protein n=1 Tax=Bradyrhizobium cosmicum TaxID=1404864 RepID=UPI0028EE2EA2|nr:hypothetical protein [Bradyrhizobium cosmicum]